MTDSSPSKKDALACMKADLAACIEHDWAAYPREEMALGIAEIERLQRDFERYRQALYRANGYLIQNGLEPVKLESSQAETEGSTILRDQIDQQIVRLNRFSIDNAKMMGVLDALRLMAQNGKLPPVVTQVIERECGHLLRPAVETESVTSTKGDNRG